MSQTGSRGNSSNFLNGVVFGALLAGAGLYLFGTRNGRQNVNKLLDVFENIDELIEAKEKEILKNKSGDSSVVTDVENLISKLQAVLPYKKSES